LAYQNTSVREDGESDLQKVWKLVIGLHPAIIGEAQVTDTEIEDLEVLEELQFFQYLFQEDVRKIFGKPKVWPTITTLANALIKHTELDSDTAWEICEECGLTWGSEF